MKAADLDPKKKPKSHLEEPSGNPESELCQKCPETGQEHSGMQCPVAGNCL